MFSGFHSRCYLNDGFLSICIMQCTVSVPSKFWKKHIKKYSIKTHILIILSIIIAYLHNYNAGKYAMYYSALKVNRLTIYI